MQVQRTASFCSDGVAFTPSAARSAASLDLGPPGRARVDDPIAELGKPKMIVSDTGTKIASNVVLAGSGDADVEWHYIAPPARRATMGHRELQW